MKYICLTIPLFIFLITGCSSTYTTKDFPSKEKFISSFNEMARNEDLTVKFIDGSSMPINDGYIIGDTLYSTCIIDNIFSQTPMHDIKKTNYNGWDHKFGTILLNNGKEIDAKDIYVINDTMYYTVIKKDYMQNPVGALERIKTVSYRNPWLGIPPAFLISTAATVVAGLIIKSVNNDNIQNRRTDVGNSFPAYLLLGPIIGLGAGVINGYTYIYQFNP